MCSDQITWHTTLICYFVESHAAGDAVGRIIEARKHLEAVATHSYIAFVESRHWNAPGCRVFQPPVSNDWVTSYAVTQRIVIWQSYWNLMLMLIY